MEQPSILPDHHADTASRKRKERSKRQANGEKRVEVWVNAEEAGHISKLTEWTGESQGLCLVNGFRRHLGLKPR